VEGIPFVYLRGFTLLQPSRPCTGQSSGEGAAKGRPVHFVDMKVRTILSPSLLPSTFLRPHFFPPRSLTAAMRFSPLRKL